MQNYNDLYYVFGALQDLNGLDLSSIASMTPKQVIDILNNIIKSIELNDNGTYTPLPALNYPIVGGKTSIKECIEYLDKAINDIQSGDIANLNISLTYENEKLYLKLNDETKSIVNIPLEQFIDISQTKFVESATQDDVLNDNSVIIGNPYLKLCLKTVKEDTSSQITYCYIPLEYLSNIYHTNNTSSINMNIDEDNIISSSLILSPDENNNLAIKNNGLFSKDYKNDIININDNISNIENNINIINDNITNIENSINNVNENINNIENDITNINNNYSNITSEIENINNNIVNITDTSLKVYPDDKILSVNQVTNEVLSTILLTYDDNSNILTLKGNDDFTISKIILKSYNELVNADISDSNILNLYLSDNSQFNIDLNQLVVKYNEGLGINILGDEISIKVNPDSDKYISIDENGIKLSGIEMDIQNINNSITELNDNVQTISQTVNENKTNIQVINQNISDMSDKLNIVESTTNGNSSTIQTLMNKIQELEQKITNIETSNKVIYEADGVSDDDGYVLSQPQEEGYDIYVLSQMFKSPHNNLWTPIMGYKGSNGRHLITGITQLGVSIVIGVSTVETYGNTPYKIYYYKVPTQTT